MRDIDTLFSGELPATLYHYTNVETMMAIVNSRTMFASHAYFLNDSKELLHGRDSLATVIQMQLVKAKGVTADFLKQSLAWLDTFDEPRHIFVTSLTENGNQLSQWRGYTSGGRGVSIGLSPDRIRIIRSMHPRLKVAKCIYDRREQSLLMWQLLELCLESFQGEVDKGALESEHPSNRYFHFLERYREEFLQVMAIIKHPAFKEESEWRLISGYYSDLSHPDIHHRSGVATLIPHLKLKLSPEDDLEAPMFKRVVVGPSRHPNLAIDSVASFLTKTKACDERLACGIPFREW